MDAFDVLGDPVRRRILEVLAEDRHAVGEILAIVGQEFGISQSALSQHLRVLREFGFATVTVDGARRIYALDPAPLVEVDDWLAQLRQHWETVRKDKGREEAVLQSPAVPSWPHFGSVGGLQILGQTTTGAGQGFLRRGLLLGWSQKQKTPSVYIKVLIF